jgi:anhydro-N-acetylmuramic acid kinase
MTGRASDGSRLALGLMSGTSVDGIDVALVRIASSITENAAHARLENFITVPFPAAVRAEVLRIAEGARVSPGELSQLNFRLGRLFGEAALRACQNFRVSPGRLSVIGSHGQTIFHQGKPSRFLGANVASTLQIGEPAMIAAITGVITVGDFRPADVAVGGQGAPLVPWVDYLLYRAGGAPF